MCRRVYLEPEHKNEGRSYYSNCNVLLECFQKRAQKKNIVPLRERELKKVGIKVTR